MAAVLITGFIKAVVADSLGHKMADVIICFSSMSGLNGALVTVWDCFSSAPFKPLIFSVVVFV